MAARNRSKSEEGADERRDRQPDSKAQSRNAKSTNGIERRARADRDHEREPGGENAGNREAPTRRLGHRISQKADDDCGASGQSDCRQNLQRDVFSFSV